MKCSPRPLVDPKRLANLLPRGIIAIGQRYGALGRVAPCCQSTLVVYRQEGHSYATNPGSF
jgi:hypothetical protein